MLDLFQILSSPDVNGWTGVFLSDSQSDGTQSLQIFKFWVNYSFKYGKLHSICF